ncbi:MAG TPA: YceI family protein [Gammaproteobacteria bacterium]|nr:YceI family protein [Gammaproteobacteria bacterium]
MKFHVLLLTGLIGLLFTAPAYAGCWAPLQQDGSIRFSISQAGAPLNGTFGAYDGLICITPGDDKADRIEVRITMASVDTRLPELDTALRGADFFDVARWPQGLFKSESVRALGGNRYEVRGQLTLRDVTRDITVPFTFTPDAGQGAQLEGKLVIQRLDYHIGLGQWSDTRWVGNQVDITFSVSLRAITQH